MSYVLTQIGSKKILNSYFNNVYPDSGKDLTLRLFVNDYTPTTMDIVSNYIEANEGGGYQSIILNNGLWSINNLTEIDYTIQVFNFTDVLNGDNTVFGYYITDGDGDLILAERCSNFTPLTNGWGNNYNVNLKFLMGSKTT
jgi:hypothetical protein